MALKLVRRHGGKNWYIRGTVRGIVVEESTRTDNKAAAETLRARRECELLEASVYGQKAVATFLQAAVSYLKNGGEARYVERLATYFGNTPLAKVDQDAVDRAARVLCPEASNATKIRQVYTPASAIYHHAAKRDWCGWRQFERPSVSAGRVRWITFEEADRLIIKCSPHLRPLVTFLLSTGARIGEALQLDWREVDLARRHVEFLETKNGEARGVPLAQRAVNALEKLPHREGRVFRRPDGFPYNDKADGGGQIKTAFRAACRRAGIANLTPHDCRHTWATWHYQENRDLIALMKLGGWKSEKMVLRYAHTNVDHLKHSIDALPWGKSGHPKKAAS